MRLKMILIWITLILSSCASHEVIVFASVEIPNRTYYPNLKQADLMQCPVDVRQSVYVNIRSRDQYIETLLDVITIHNRETK